MADDTTLFISDLASLEYCIQEFLLFEQCSGLKLNIAKTEIIPIGKLKQNKPVLKGNLVQIKIKELPFKALGVWYSDNEAEVSTLNTNDRIHKINVNLNMWRARKLSLKGKIMIIKTLILPQIQFLFALIHMDSKILQHIDTILFQFLWNGKPAKIKRSTMIAPIEQGGLKMIDTHEVHNASKIGWIKRLFDTNNGKWKTLFKYMLNMDEHFLCRNYIKNANRIGKTLFHQQVLNSWNILTTEVPTKLNQILDQKLIHNNYIKIGGRAIAFDSYKATDPKIYHIIDNNGKFIPLQVAKQVISRDLNELSYNSIKTAIPKNWREIIKKDIKESEISISDGHMPHICVSQNLVPIIKLKNKQIYNKLIEKKTNSPTAINTWINIYPFLEKIHWKNIYNTNTKITKEPYLQSFNYKILNRITNCNHNLHKWGLSNNNTCAYCPMVDTIEHHFFDCPVVKNMWTKLEIWLKDNQDIIHNFKLCEILLGVPEPYFNDIDTFTIINYMSLILKWYINQQRTLKEIPYFIDFLSILRNKLIILTYTNTQEIQPGEMNGEDWKVHLLDSL